MINKTENLTKILALADNFDRLRKWFNANFKLCVNYHYAGLKRIPYYMLMPFLRRLAAVLDRPSYDGGRIKFRLGHQKISVYPF